MPNPRLSCSMEMQEWLIEDGQTAMSAGAAAGGATHDDDTTVFKTGTESCENILHAASAAGIIAYSLGKVHELAVLDDDNISAMGANYIKFWSRSSVTVAAGAYKIGLSDANDGTMGASGSVDMPAMTTNIWQRNVVALNATQAALTSVSAWMIDYVTDTGNADSLFLDDVRLAKYIPIGNSSITLPSSLTLNNTNGDGINTDMWYFPYRSRVVRIDSDASMTITFYCGANAATWTSSDTVQAVYHVQGGVPAEFTVEATAMSFILDHNVHRLDIAADSTTTKVIGGKVLVEVSQ